MEKLTNIIEAILFASGEGVPLNMIAEKLNVTPAQVKKSVEALKEKYASDCGIHILTFNNKAQLASNPTYKDQVADVLNSIREKEFTRTILESAAIIAYKQPITKGELEEIRRVNSDYAVKTLLDLKMIEPCGRKDAIGKPILYATTDNFLKRFHISSLAELPDYEELLSSIAALNGNIEDDNALYHEGEYTDQVETEASDNSGKAKKKPVEQTPKEVDDESFAADIPDFLKDVDLSDIIRIE